MKTKLSILIICAFVFAYSCENRKEQPEIVYKDSLGIKIVNDTIEVVQNSGYELIIETKYDLSKPEYLIKQNSDLVNITDSENLNIVCHGWSGEFELNFENAKLYVNFSDSIYKKGDIIQIITRINTLSDGLVSKSKYYKIE